MYYQLLIVIEVTDICEIVSLIAGYSSDGKQKSLFTN
jgi:hypothetical protein